MGSYASSPEVVISSKLSTSGSAYIHVDRLATERLGIPIGRVGDGDGDATDVDELLPGLVRPVVRGDDVALGFNAVNFDTSIVLPSSSSYDDDLLT